MDFQQSGEAFYQVKINCCQKVAQKDKKTIEKLLSREYRREGNANNLLAKLRASYPDYEFWVAKFTPVIM